MSIIPYSNKDAANYVICKTAEYQDWYDSLECKSQGEIERRLQKIVEDGLRIYFVRTGKREITLLLGGFKNGQKKDIKKAKSFIC